MTAMMLTASHAGKKAVNGMLALNILLVFASLVMAFSAYKSEGRQPDKGALIHEKVRNIHEHERNEHLQAAVNGFSFNFQGKSTERRERLRGFSCASPDKLT